MDAFVQALSWTLGFVNGSPLNSIASCLKEIGVIINTETRQTWQNTGHGLMPRVTLGRAQHIIAALRQNIIVCAFIGKDMLYEYARPGEFVICAELGISKNGFEHAPKVVFFRREDSRIVYLKDIRPDTIIITEYPVLTARFLAERGIQAIIVPSSGGTEHAIVSGLGDLGVCVVDTGTSLAANNLVVVDCLMEAPIAICIRPGDPCEKLARNLGELLQGVLKSHERVLLKMNVSAGEKAKVLAMVPSLKAPTIHKLAQNKGYAVETVVSRKELAWLVIRLKDLGARDFIWHELNGIVP